MAGNVLESCLNKYEKSEQPEVVRIDKEFGRSVIRGGSWFSTPEVLRVSFRNWNFAVYRNNFIGFRLAQDIEP